MTDRISVAELERIAGELLPGDGVRFDLDFRGSPLVIDPPKFVEGTFISYDKTFQAWHIVEWAPDNRKLIVLNDWVTSVHPRVARAIEWEARQIGQPSETV